MATVSKTPSAHERDTLGIPQQFDRRAKPNGLDNQALLDKIAMLEAKLALANKPKAMAMKVSEKGACSVYGLSRFPVTLYSGQWERLLAAKDDILAFIEANRASLATKE